MAASERASALINRQRLDAPHVCRRWGLLSAMACSPTADLRSERFLLLRKICVAQVKEKTFTRSMLYALDKGLADFDLSSQPRARMAAAIVVTKHGPAMSPAGSYSPLQARLSLITTNKVNKKATQCLPNRCNIKFASNRLSRQARPRGPKPRRGKDRHDLGKPFILTRDKCFLRVG